MPDQKTPRAKRASATAVKGSAGHALPDRSAMEAYVAALTTDEVHSAARRAQNVMYDAWEARTSRSRMALAHKALAISPLCADAYNLFAMEAGTTRDRHDLYARGLEAGALELGPEGFEDYDGNFWGFLETRPYMRARHGLMLSLLELGQEDEALAHGRAMLKLNPNDNQGIRYLVLGILLRRDDIAALEILLADYPKEWSVHWLYTRLLLAYRQNLKATPATGELLAEARSANSHVAALLAGDKPLRASTTGYITVGGADEAAEYVRDCGPAWRTTPGAVEWLSTAIIP